MNKIIAYVENFFSDEENPQEPHYDPAHIGAMIVLVLLGISVLFWLLWSLMVFGGGIQSKIVPAVKVLLSNKTVQDFGYIGYPYEMGVFEGWVTNVVALIFLMLVITAISYVFKDRQNGNKLQR